MLVALPSAIAFGVTIFAPLGADYAAQGALAGILGATALGLVASALGGAPRLITAPCAPAAAVLSAFALQLTQGGTAAEAVLLMLALTGLLCGGLQVLFGAVRLGQLIKYMPYPVVSGYLSGVGLIIVVSQVPKLLGVPGGTDFWASLASPSLWAWQAMLVGIVTIAVMGLADRFTKVVPAAILGLASGTLVYLGLGLFDPALLSLEGNALVIGPLHASGEGLGDALVQQWKAMGALGPGTLFQLFMPAVTLAVLLSIDTLKTCVVLDALTRSRHDSNRELVGQGVGNLVSSLAGGVPGAGTMGATLVNLSSGGRTRISGIAEGVLSLLAFALLAGAIGWLPIAALAGILIAIGVKMFDRQSLRLLGSRSTLLDFAVIVAVVVVALTVNLIAASGTGIALAIALFVREQIGGSIVRRKAYGNRLFSRRMRLPQEMAVLDRRGDRTAIFELQGSIFFGTTDQLYKALEQDLKTSTYLILDMRRVQSVDVTAAHLLQQIEETLAERNAYLIFSDLPSKVPSGQDMRRYLNQAGLDEEEHHARIFAELDDALEWVEDRILAGEQLERPDEALLELRDIVLFRGRKEETLAALETCMEQRSCKAGTKIFAQGDDGDELYLIRRGEVRIVLPYAQAGGHHLATFGRGNFFGEMAFLDRQLRSADAIAFTDCDLFVLSRRRFEAFAERHRALALNLLGGLASALAERLRYADAEMQALEN